VLGEQELIYDPLVRVSIYKKEKMVNPFSPRNFARSQRFLVGEIQMDFESVCSGELEHPESLVGRHMDRYTLHIAVVHRHNHSMGRQDGWRTYYFLLRYPSDYPQNTQKRH
jgi:hypothetical protein